MTLDIFLFFVFVLIILALLYIVAIDLGKHNTSDLQTVVFLFVFSSYIASNGIYWGIQSNAIDDYGKMTPFVANIFHHILYLEPALILYLVLVGALIIPQVISFILTGIIGYGSKLKYIGISIDFFFWLIIKSFLTWSGVVTTIYFFNLHYKWIEHQNSPIVLITSLLLLLITLLFVFYRTNLKKLFANIKTSKYFEKLIKIMRRNIKDENNQHIDYILLALDITDILNKHHITINQLADEINKYHNNKQ